MQKKTLVATLFLAGSMVILFAAAKVQDCAQAYKGCATACNAELSKCKLSGRPDETCDQAFKQCMKKCDNAKADCEKNSKK